MKKFFMELTEAEIEALWRLSSAYQACTHSVCAPVAVPSDVIMPSNGKHIFSDIFYDCTEPESVGINTMKQRIRDGGEDIQSHLKIHRNILGGFNSVDDALRENDKPRVVEAGNIVYENLENYGKLVKTHFERFGERGFLDYPTCLPGHYFAPVRKGLIIEK